jgi:hypothetical protein
MPLGPVMHPKILSAWQSNLNRDIPHGDDGSWGCDASARLLGRKLV